VLATVVFLGSFAWSFVYVELPFYAGRLTTYDVGPTLAWTGWILGITSLVSVVSTPVWGRYSDQHDPRGILVGMHLFQAIGFLGAAVVRSLPALFLVRCALGAVGASATVAPSCSRAASLTPPNGAGGWLGSSPQTRSAALSGP